MVDTDNTQTTDDKQWTMDNATGWHKLPRGELKMCHTVSGV